MARYTEEKVLYFAESKGLHVGTREKGTTLGDLVSRAVKQQNLKQTKQDGTGRYFDITDKGKMRLLSLQIQIRKQMKKPTHEHEAKLAALKSPNSTPQPQKPTFQASAPQSKPVAELTMTASLQEFLEDGAVVTRNHGDQFSPSAQMLFDEGYLVFDGSDAEAVFFGPSDSARLALDKIVNAPSPTITNFDGSLTLTQYREKGEALTRPLIGELAFSGVNELHWDVCFEDKLSFEEAIQPLVDSKEGLEFNAPVNVMARQEQTKKIADELQEKFGDTLDPNQIENLLKKRVGEELGMTIDNTVAYQLSQPRKSTPQNDVEESPKMKMSM
tara:strand:- start:2387 stop:3373 length:987 start_codon:yes stop_codon:yes gene_type:complete